ncbi:tRNA (adenosine(37)-N6)-dimethylallyltransferase MiaA [Tannockella kyphosi]|uniref:tRNA (adenosine(37)-N6)-dimethylallyltransferase MiaA n=1 Tax=Tannockella kyphosi TaxID=2899121 RepID=UPI002011C326|nr:tRNA (adenosine(37)-N6)-dimethylallyltransferase MiaA [Tannockella kyphosi]
MEKVIVIVGPTSVGKTKLGVELAKEFNGEVISGDSMQVYRTMDIGTAKVTKEEAQGIVHYLIDIKDPKESYSVKEFQEQVRFYIQDITSRGKLPIIVGGTGLYIKAALYDYTFEESETDHEAYTKKFEEYSNEQLHQYLQTIDENSAKELHPNNRRRIVRAIEIFETTGITKSENHEKQEHVCLYNALFIGLTLPRDVLYQRIDQRVHVMMENGLEKEVEQLIDAGMQREDQSMKGIGYKEWFDYIEDKQSLEQTVSLIQQHSRNLAKRQYTWFKNQFEMYWITICIENFEQTIKEAKQYIIKEQS